MNLVTWLVVGALVGWFACRLARASSPQALAFDVTIGLVGAFLGGWFVAPLTGAGPLEVDGTSPMWLGIAAAGAALLLLLARLVRRTDRH